MTDSAITEKLNGIIANLRVVADAINAMGVVLIPEHMDDALDPLGALANYNNKERLMHLVNTPIFKLEPEYFELLFETPEALNRLAIPQLEAAEAILRHENQAPDSAALVAAALDELRAVQQLMGPGAA